MVVRCGEDLLTVLGPREWGDWLAEGCIGLDIDEVVTIVTVENSDQATWSAEGGDVLAIWGEPGPNNPIVVLERANESLPGRCAPDAHFVVIQPSPGGKSSGVRGDIDRIHRPCTLHVDDFFMHLCIPDTCASLASSTDYPLGISGYGNGAQLHSRLLPDLLTV